MRLYVMTGDFMTGKTSWIERMLINAGLPIESSNPAVREWVTNASVPSTSSIRINGIYTPAVFENGEKIGIDATLLPSCERFAFATRRPGFNGNEQEHHAATANEARNKLGWLFDDAALSRANSLFASIEPDSCDLLLIDELGPLELIRGGGYTKGLELLDGVAVKNALIVVRPALLDAAQERWGKFETIGTDASIGAFLNSLK